MTHLNMASNLYQRKFVTPAVSTKTEDEPSTSKDPGRARPILLSYDEIPAWYQDNPHIHTGYRPVSNSARLCFNSWLYLHNETFNIFSHFLPGALLLIGQPVLYRFVQARYPGATTGDHLVVSFLLLCATVCFMVSATYHTLMNHSEGVSNLWLRLDYVGIIVLTLGDFVSGIRMVFWCELALQKAYWAMVPFLLILMPSPDSLAYRSSFLG